MTEREHAAERNAAIDRAFNAALDREGEARAAFLAALRDRDAALGDAVARLLAAAARPDPRLEPDAWSSLRIRAEPASGAPAPERVGPYRVVREIGRGGMSVVYHAERADGQFEQRVALKFLDVPHGRGLRRFERERQILAGLNHPHIARLLDGGSDEAGRPYIVMEYVEGRPIDDFCDATRADLRRRLALVAVVADAVEYAHRNLVVHQDLKPSNILVTDDGQVKLLDFGIARLLTSSASTPAAPSDTRTVFRALTPEYASPEQVRGERVTTATDVYQLGVLLYELLVGRRPFAPTNASLAELERAICAGAATLPSVAAARLRHTLPGVEQPAALRRRLRGDLDAIVLKALAPEPERRYASVGELRDDLQRFQDGAPVRARTPTFGYRASRFVRRHRAGVATAAGLALLLASYAATVTTQSRRLRAEAAKTEQVTQFLANLFAAANPGNSQGHEPTASDLLAAGARRIAELEGQPEVQAELLVLLGEVHGTRGQFAQAADLLEQALALQRLHLRARDPRLARAAHSLGQVRHYQGRLHEAESLLREALAIRRLRPGETSPDVGLILDDLGDLLHTQGRLDEAEAVLRRALPLLSTAGYSTATTERHLANVHRDRGAAAEAEPLYRRSLGATEARFGVMDPIASLTRSELALLLAETGRHEEAESLLVRNRNVYETLYPGGHAMLGTTFRNLGVLRLRQGRPAEARALLERALAVYGETLADESTMIPRTHRYLAEARLAEGDARGAAVEAAAAVRRLRALGLPGHPAVADALETCAAAELAQGNAPRAAALLAESLALRERLSVTTDPRLAATRARLAAARAAAASDTLLAATPP